MPPEVLLYAHVGVSRTILRLPDQLVDRRVGFFVYDVDVLTCLYKTELQAVARGNSRRQRLLAGGIRRHDTRLNGSTLRTADSAACFDASSEER